MGVIWPVIGPLANALVVIVIVIFMLLAGEDLRDRLIHLMGRGRLRVTTQALDVAGHRISRYLRAQLLVNASFGLAIGAGLYFIGVPNCVFWGLLGMVLRFLPYIGRSSPRHFRSRFRLPSSNGGRSHFSQSASSSRLSWW